MDIGILGLPANMNCCGLSRVSWALAQISCSSNRWYRFSHLYYNFADTAVKRSAVSNLSI